MRIRINAPGPTDTTAPRVTSIEYGRTQISPTHQDTVEWTVTFDEAVKNVDATDFEVSNTSAMLDAEARGDASVYTVQLSGGDLADLDATITLSFASGQNIQDLASNDLTNTMPTGTNDNMIVVDNTAPTVTITDVPTDSTGAFPATFTFDEAVTGFALGDITVGNGAPSNLQNPSSDNRTFTAEITPASTGTVTVDVAANTARDAAGNGNTAAIQVSSAYTEPVIATNPDAPTGLMANPEDAQVTLNWTVGADGGSAIITHRIRWKEGSGFYTGWTDIPNSAPSETNATSYTVTGLTNGTAYTFQVRAENGVGESIAPHATSPQVTPSATDTTAPTVTSIVRQDPTTSPTNADTLIWRVTFNEDVKDVGGADFEITGPTGASLSVTAMTGSSSVYDVTASGGDLASLDDTVTLSFASGQDIKDIANNNLTDTAPTGTNDFTFVVDNTAPTVTSIERRTPTTSPTNVNSLAWLVTFSEALPFTSPGPGTDDFVVSGTTGSFFVQPRSSTEFVVGVGGGDLDDLNDTVTLTFATGQNITDPAGNALVNVTPTSGTNDNFFVLDNTAPTVTITAASTSTGPFTATFTFDEAVTGFAVGDITVGNGAPSNLQNPSSDNRTFTATITPVATGTVTLNVAANVAEGRGGQRQHGGGTGVDQPYGVRRRHHRADGDLDRAPGPDNLADQRGHPDMARDLQREREGHRRRGFRDSRDDGLAGRGPP